MNDYRPDKFNSIFTRFDGARLWAWLHRAEVVAMMETASYLRRPAVEPLSPLLEQEFADQIAMVKVRQMVGHMIRQILEPRGYMLDRSNVQINRDGNLFNFGSSYRRLAL